MKRQLVGFGRIPMLCSRVIKQNHMFTSESKIGILVTEKHILFLFYDLNEF